MNTEPMGTEQLAEAALEPNTDSGRVFLLKRWWSKQEVIAENELISRKISKLSAAERRAVSEAAARY